MRLLLLARDIDDGTDYVLAHPEIREYRITMAWPWGMDRVGDGLFDRLAVTAGFNAYPRSASMIAAAQLRVRPAPVVFTTGEHAELMGLGGLDA